jgi:hypothetical protein
MLRSIASSVGTWWSRRCSILWSIVNTHWTRKGWPGGTNHIAGCLKSALVGKSTVELYCDLDGLQAPGGGSIPTDVMVQAQRPDLVIVDWSVYGRFRIALVKLTCPWDTDAKRAEERKTTRYIQTSRRNWAIRGGIVVCICSRLERGATLSSRLRTTFGRYSGLGSLQVRLV